MRHILKCISWIILCALFLTPLVGCGLAPVRSDPRPRASISEYETDVSLLAASKPWAFGRAEASAKPTPDEVQETEEAQSSYETIADPLEPVNRGVYYFNDKLYFWVWKPVATGYKAVLPQGVRVSVRNFFSNLTTPIRFVNTVLQGNLEGSSIELFRFIVNTTVGVGGLFDPATKWADLPKQEADFGQTLGIYGLKSGFYIVLPIFGPSSMRDAVGLAGDAFLNPLSYLFLVTPVGVATGIGVQRLVNETSLNIGVYEDLKESALDPYIALRNAYYQNRQHQIEKGRSRAEEPETGGNP
jgi:phospholipid-binding lipoprotein MlaA